MGRRFHEHIPHIPHILPIRPEMKEHFESEPAQREAVTAFNGPLQAGYFILAVRAFGLATRPRSADSITRPVDQRWVRWAAVAPDVVAARGNDV